MCKYCTEIFTGYTNDKLIKLEIEVNGIWMSRIQTHIDHSDGKTYIRTHLDDESGYPIADGKMEIHYCPVCGRKLEKGPE